MRTILKGIGIAIVLILVSGISFIVAVEHPTTRGPLRCWIQENLYAQDWADAPDGTAVIAAKRTTEPVRDMCDAADDPAIWVDAAIPEGALVLGTNKQSSLNVYDMSGKLLSRANAIGAPNNVDVRAHGGLVLAMASDKDDAEIEAYNLDLESGALTLVNGAPFAVEAEEEVYGLCMYSNADALYAITTDKSGLINQYKIDINRGAVTKVRTLRVSTQPEGCVVDDVNRHLFVGEEDIGIWRFSADPTAASDGKLIAKTGKSGPLTADIEGLAIYAGQEASAGYLIASSQGDNTYAVFDRAPPHAFKGRFQISDNGILIGDTDGLDVTSRAIAPDYPAGLLVVQDGFIRDENGKRRNQRFAYVSWADVESALGLQSLDTISSEN
ncbi:MAG: phytase [Pseudomonadota bacterium]